MISFNAKISGAKTQPPEDASMPIKSTLRTKPIAVSEPRCSKPAYMYLAILTAILVTLLCLIASLWTRQNKNQTDNLCFIDRPRSRRRMPSRDSQEKDEKHDPPAGAAGASSDPGPPGNGKVSRTYKVKISSSDEHFEWTELSFDAPNHAFRDGDEILDGITRPIMDVGLVSVLRGEPRFCLHDSTQKEFTLCFKTWDDCDDLRSAILEAKTYTPMFYRGLFEYLLSTNITPKEDAVQVPEDYDFAKNIEHTEPEDMEKIEHQLMKRYVSLDVSSCIGRKYFLGQFQSVYRQSGNSKRDRMKEKPGIFTILLREFMKNACGYKSKNKEDRMDNAEPLYRVLADLEKLSQRLVNFKNAFETILQESAEKNGHTIWSDIFEVAIEANTKNVPKSPDAFLTAMLNAAYVTERLRVEKYVKVQTQQKDILKHMKVMMENIVKEIFSGLEGIDTQFKEKMKAAEQMVNQMRSK